MTTPPDSYEIGTATVDTGSELHVDAVGEYVLRDELQAPVVALSWEEYDDEDEPLGWAQFNLTPDSAERLSALLAEGASKARKITTTEENDMATVSTDTSNLGATEIDVLNIMRRWRDTLDSATSLAKVLELDGELQYIASRVHDAQASLSRKAPQVLLATVDCAEENADLAFSVIQDVIGRLDVATPYLNRSYRNITWTSFDRDESDGWYELAGEIEPDDAPVIFDAVAESGMPVSQTEDAATLCLQDDGGPSVLVVIRVKDTAASVTEVEIDMDAVDTEHEGAIAFAAYMTRLGEGAALPRNDYENEWINGAEYVSLSNINGWLATVKIPVAAGDKCRVFVTEDELADAIGPEKAGEILSTC